MTIAVDFDGTIVEHNYPLIGREIPFAIDILKKLQRENNQIILWTVRHGDLLDEAVDYCRRRGLEFYAVNSNNPDEQPLSSSDIYPCSCRKLRADMFIDDRCVCGLPSWGNIYDMIHNGWTYDRYLRETLFGEDHNVSFWKKLFRRV